ncbi:sortase (surface protein transpeptidase) [Modestobacter roseus]|uniref:Sortase (Surface protein transpeptidase) n=2 Tax=Modestobacter roseus TaxID=1181884 RepID=A0A562IVU8_9ACTN|nr:class F sortase [Modestobacter roseus]TWH75159.1 sortase (surface protein transpeptidase) [Modestobacter roseus]TWH75161.1 sortase (surface protein transpeptidase) [Modestobacter roseus]
MRAPVAGMVLGLTLAIGTPVAWAVTRPDPATGSTVEQALDAPPPSAVPSPSGAAPPTASAPAFPPVPTRDAAPTPPAPVPAPVRVSLPAQGVDAPLDPVGVSPDGQMELPEDVDRVGWYRFGPVPGDEGSAVLAGHVDDREQGLGALFPLRDAQTGDVVVVTGATGAETRWQVVSRELITKQALPLDSIFNREGPPRLVLVTCGGPFDAETRSYRDNVVVVAQPLP